MQNRLSGFIVLLLGIVLLCVLIPHQTETVDYGWLRPATLPSITGVVIIIAGAVHLLVPRGKGGLNAADSFRALLLLAIGIAGLWAMHLFGFIVAAPLMMLVLMLRTGERRWLWLLTGVVVLPAFIWFCIDFLLKRPLP